MVVELINIHLISIQQKRLVKKLHYFSCKNHNKQILKWCWNGWNQIQNPIIGLTSLVGLHWEKWTIFVGKIEGSQLKKFYTFLLSTQLYQKKGGKPTLPLPLSRLSQEQFQFQKLEIEFFFSSFHHHHSKVFFCLFLLWGLLDFLWGYLYYCKEKATFKNWLDW